MTDRVPGPPEPEGEPPLLDFPSVHRRLRRLALVAGAVALVGAAVDAAGGTPPAAAVGRWVGLLLAATLLGAAAVVATSALTGADRAQRRGQRLSAGDVGWLPRRRR